MREDLHLQVLELYLCAAFLVALGLWCAHRWLSPHARHRQHAESAATFLLGLEVGAYVAAWYGISVSFTMFNKWLLRYWHNGAFNLPVTATAVHMGVKWLLARTYVRAKYGPDSPLLATPPQQLLCKGVIPVGVATAGDVALSNLSFLYITVTFYTIAKSCTLVWTLVWAVLLGLERVRCSMVLTVAVISTGLALASWGESDFSMVGFVMVIGAGCLGGLRWSLTQLLLSHDDGWKTPMLIVYHIAPSSVISMVPVALIFEGGNLAKFVAASDSDTLLQALAYVGCGGIIAFTLIVVEVKLVQATTALTMGVFGQVKEMVQILLAISIFSDDFSWLNGCGLFLAMLGTLMYQRLVTLRAKTRGLGEYEPVVQQEFVEHELSPFSSHALDVDSEGDSDFATRHPAL